MDKILLFNLALLLKVLHVWLPIKLGFWEVRDNYWWGRQKVTIFVWDFRGRMRFSSLIISYVAKIYMNKGEKMVVFFVWWDWIYQIWRQAIYAWLLLTLGYLSKENFACLKEHISLYLSVLKQFSMKPDINSFVNSVHPDQLASEEASWSGSTLFFK